MRGTPIGMTNIKSNAKLIAAVKDPEVQSTVKSSWVRARKIREKGDDGHVLLLLLLLPLLTS